MATAHDGLLENLPMENVSVESHILGHLHDLNDHIQNDFGEDLCISHSDVHFRRESLSRKS